LSAVTAAVFTLNSTVYGVPRNIWEGKVNADKASAGQPLAYQLDTMKLTVPEIFGTVTERFVSAGTENAKKLIIQIQDSHCNYEAQTNICRIIESLSADKAAAGVLKLLAVEGATGKRDLSYERSLPEPDIRKAVSDYMMKIGWLTGTEVYAITCKEEPLPLWGIENQALYDENLGYFRDSKTALEKENAFIEKLSTLVDTLKTKVFSAAVKQMMEMRDKWDNNAVTFAEYCSYIDQVARENGLGEKGADRFMDPKAYPNFTKVLEAIQIEKKIDIKKIETERTACVDQIQKKMVKEELAELVRQSINFRVGKATSEMFYAYLRDTAAAKQIDLAKFPNLTGYMDIVALNSAVKAGELFEEVDRIEQEIKEKMLAGSDEKQLDRTMKEVRLMKNLIDLRLSRREYDTYINRRSEITPAQILTKLEKIADNEGMRDTVAGTLAWLSENKDVDMDACEKFYEAAVKRDTVLVQNTLREMDARRSGAAVVVTGGFHTQGMKELFKAKGYSYVVVMPRMVQAHDEKIYLARMLDKESEFDKLFAASGRRLPPAMIGGTPREQGLYWSIANRILGLLPASPMVQRLAAWLNVSQPAVVDQAMVGALSVKQDPKTKALDVAFNPSVPEKAETLIADFFEKGGLRLDDVQPAALKRLLDTNGIPADVQRAAIAQKFAELLAVEDEGARVDAVALLVRFSAAFDGLRDGVVAVLRSAASDAASGVKARKASLLALSEIVDRNDPEEIKSLKGPIGTLAADSDTGIRELAGRVLAALGLAVPPAMELARGPVAGAAPTGINESIDPTLTRGTWLIGQHYPTVEEAREKARPIDVQQFIADAEKEGKNKQLSEALKLIVQAYDDKKISARLLDTIARFAVLNVPLSQKGMHDYFVGHPGQRARTIFLTQDLWDEAAGNTAVLAANILHEMQHIADYYDEDLQKQLSGKSEEERRTILEDRAKQAQWLVASDESVKAVDDRVAAKIEARKPTYVKAIDASIGDIDTLMQKEVALYDQAGLRSAVDSLMIGISQKPEVTAQDFIADKRFVSSLQPGLKNALIKEDVMTQVVDILKRSWLTQREITLRAERQQALDRKRNAAERLTLGKIDKEAYITDQHGSEKALQVDQELADKGFRRNYGGDEIDRGIHGLKLVDRITKAVSENGANWLWGNHNMIFMYLFLTNYEGTGKMPMDAFKNWIKYGGDLVMQEVTALYGDKVEKLKKEVSEAKTDEARAALGEQLAQAEKIAGQLQETEKKAASLRLVADQQPDLDAKEEKRAIVFTAYITSIKMILGLPELKEAAAAMRDYGKLFYYDELGGFHSHVGVVVNDDGLFEYNGRVYVTATELERAMKDDILRGDYFWSQNEVPFLADEKRSAFRLAEGETAEQKFSRQRGVTMAVHRYHGHTPLTRKSASEIAGYEKYGSVFYDPDFAAGNAGYIEISPEQGMVRTIVKLDGTKESQVIRTVEQMRDDVLDGMIEDYLALNPELARSAAPRALADISPAEQSLIFAALAVAASGENPVIAQNAFAIAASPQPIKAVTQDMLNAYDNLNAAADQTEKIVRPAIDAAVAAYAAGNAEPLGQLIEKMTASPLMYGIGLRTIEELISKGAFKNLSDVEPFVTLFERVPEKMPVDKDAVNRLSALSMMLKDTKFKSGPAVVAIEGIAKTLAQRAESKTIAEELGEMSSAKLVDKINGSSDVDAIKEYMQKYEVNQNNIVYIAGVKKIFELAGTLQGDARQKAFNALMKIVDSLDRPGPELYGAGLDILTRMFTLLKEEGAAQEKTVTAEAVKDLMKNKAFMYVSPETLALAVKEGALGRLTDAVLNTGNGGLITSVRGILMSLAGQKLADADKKMIDARIASLNASLIALASEGIAQATQKGDVDRLIALATSYIGDAGETTYLSAMKSLTDLVRSGSVTTEQFYKLLNQFIRAPGDLSDQEYKAIITGLMAAALDRYDAGLKDPIDILSNIESDPFVGTIRKMIDEQKDQELAAYYTGIFDDLVDKKIVARTDSFAAKSYDDLMTLLKKGANLRPAAHQGVYRRVLAGVTSLLQAKEISEEDFGQILQRLSMGAAAANAIEDAALFNGFVSGVKARVEGLSTAECENFIKPASLYFTLLSQRTAAGARKEAYAQCIEALNAPVIQAYKEKIAKATVTEDKPETLKELLSQVRQYDFDPQHKIYVAGLNKLSQLIRTGQVKDDAAFTAIMTKFNNLPLDELAGIQDPAAITGVFTTLFNCLVSQARRPDMTVDALKTESQRLTQLGKMLFVDFQARRTIGDAQKEVISGLKSSYDQAMEAIMEPVVEAYKRDIMSAADVETVLALTGQYNFDPEHQIYARGLDKLSQMIRAGKVTGAGQFTRILEKFKEIPLDALTGIQDPAAITGAFNTLFNCLVAQASRDDVPAAVLQEEYEQLKNFGKIVFEYYPNRSAIGDNQKQAVAAAEKEFAKTIGSIDEMIVDRANAEINGIISAKESLGKKDISALIAVIEKYNYYDKFNNYGFAYTVLENDAVLRRLKDPERAKEIFGFLETMAVQGKYGTKFSIYLQKTLDLLGQIYVREKVSRDPAAAFTFLSNKSFPQVQALMAVVDAALKAPANKLTPLQQVQLKEMEKIKRFSFETKQFEIIDSTLRSVFDQGDEKEFNALIAELPQRTTLRELDNVAARLFDHIQQKSADMPDKCKVAFESIATALRKVTTEDSARKRLLEYLVAEAAAREKELEVAQLQTTLARAGTEEEKSLLTGKIKVSESGQVKARMEEIITQLGWVEVGFGNMNVVEQDEKLAAIKGLIADTIAKAYETNNEVAYRSIAVGMNLLIDKLVEGRAISPEATYLFIDNLLAEVIKPYEAGTVDKVSVGKIVRQNAEYIIDIMKKQARVNLDQLRTDQDRQDAKRYLALSAILNKYMEFLFELRDKETIGDTRLTEEDFKIYTQYAQQESLFSSTVFKLWQNLDPVWKEQFLKLAGGELGMIMPRPFADRAAGRVRVLAKIPNSDRYAAGILEPAANAAGRLSVSYDGEDRLATAPMSKADALKSVMTFGRSWFDPVREMWNNMTNTLTSLAPQSFSSASISLKSLPEPVRRPFVLAIEELSTVFLPLYVMMSVTGGISWAAAFPLGTLALGVVAIPFVLIHFSCDPVRIPFTPELEAFIVDSNKKAAYERFGYDRIKGELSFIGTVTQGLTEDEFRVLTALYPDAKDKEKIALLRMRAEPFARYAGPFLLSVAGCAMSMLGVVPGVLAAARFTAHSAWNYLFVPLFRSVGVGAALSRAMVNKLTSTPEIVSTDRLKAEMLQKHIDNPALYAPYVAALQDEPARRARQLVETKKRIAQLVALLNDRRMFLAPEERGIADSIIAAYQEGVRTEDKTMRSARAVLYDLGLNFPGEGDHDKIKNIVDAFTAGPVERIPGLLQKMNSAENKKGVSPYAALRLFEDAKRLKENFPGYTASMGPNIDELMLGTAPVVDTGKEHLGGYVSLTSWEKKSEAEIMVEIVAAIKQPLEKNVDVVVGVTTDFALKHPKVMATIKGWLQEKGLKPELNIVQMDTPQDVAELATATVIERGWNEFYSVIPAKDLKLYSDMLKLANLLSVILSDGKTLSRADLEDLKRLDATGELGRTADQVLSGDIELLPIKLITPADIEEKQRAFNTLGYAA